MTGLRLVVSLFGQGRWRFAARHVLGPVLVVGRGRGRERGGQGRFVGGSHRRGTACGTKQDPSPAQQEPVPGTVVHRSIRNMDHRLSAAFGDARERPPGLQCDLQAVVGTSAKLIPVTFAQSRDVRASREQARWH